MTKELKLEDIELKRLKKVKPGRTFAANRSYFSCLKKSVFLSCALNSRWVLWSNTFFFLGNICFIYGDILDIRNDFDEETERTYQLFAFLAAFLFVLNPISDFMGSYAEEKASELLEQVAFDIDESSDSDTLQSNVDFSKETQDSEVNYDKLVAIIFLIGSLLQLIVFFFPQFDLLDVMATQLFVVDSLLALIGWHMSSQSDPKRSLFASSLQDLDWSGHGDWLFFFGSILDAVTILIPFSSHSEALISLSSDLLWLLNSVLYTIGYIYGQDVKRRSANKYYTNLTLERVLIEEQEDLGNVSVELGNDLIVAIP